MLPPVAEGLLEDLAILSHLDANSVRDRPLRFVSIIDHRLALVDAIVPGLDLNLRVVLPLITPLEAVLPVSDLVLLLFSVPHRQQRHLVRLAVFEQADATDGLGLVDRDGAFAGQVPRRHAGFVDTLRLALGDIADRRILVQVLFALDDVLRLLLPDLLLDTGEVVEPLEHGVVESLQVLPDLLLHFASAPWDTHQPGGCRVEDLVAFGHFEPRLLSL